MDLEILVENVLNAVTAGITIGCIYGLMCIGLGLIFGIMRIVNFAQGELLMLGMFTSFYLVTGGKALAFAPDTDLRRVVRADRRGRRKRRFVRWASGRLPRLGAERLRPMEATALRNLDDRSVEYVALYRRV